VNRDPEVFGPDAAASDPCWSVPHGGPVQPVVRRGMHVCIGQDLAAGVVPGVGTDRQTHCSGWCRAVQHLFGAGAARHRRPARSDANTPPYRVATPSGRRHAVTYRAACQDVCPSSAGVADARTPVRRRRDPPRPCPTPGHLTPRWSSWRGRACPARSRCTTARRRDRGRMTASARRSVDGGAARRSRDRADHRMDDGAPGRSGAEDGVMSQQSVIEELQRPGMSGYEARRTSPWSPGTPLNGYEVAKGSSCRAAWYTTLGSSSARRGVRGAGGRGERRLHPLPRAPCSIGCAAIRLVHGRPALGTSRGRPPPQVRPCTTKVGPVVAAREGGGRGARGATNCSSPGGAGDPAPRRWSAAPLTRASTCRWCRSGRS
jgi:hypothetical protein